MSAMDDWKKLAAKSSKLFDELVEQVKFMHPHLNDDEATYTIMGMLVGSFVGQMLRAGATPEEVKKLLCQQVDKLKGMKENASAMEEEMERVSILMSQRPGQGNN